MKPIAALANREYQVDDFLRNLMPEERKQFRYLSDSRQARGIKWGGFIELGGPPGNYRTRAEIIEIVGLSMQQEPGNG